jgi:hypothetical protein
MEHAPGTICKSNLELVKVKNSILRIIQIEEKIAAGMLDRFVQLCS